LKSFSVNILFRFILLFVLVPGISIQSFAQVKNKGVVYGQITGDDGKGLSQAVIQVNEADGGKKLLLTAVSNNDGNFELQVPAETALTLSFSMLGYIHRVSQIIVKPTDRVNLSIRLQIEPKQLSTVIINERLDRTLNVIHIDPKSAAAIPTPNGNVEDLIKSQPGVSSNNELSSQYNVRGGNYDENLVYVNDIEIFRPFLVRSGQQEGLSFLNSDLISNINFSAGGFEAKYGDKMSSVLDIQYRRPYEFSSTVMMSLLGGSIHFEGISKNQKFTWLTGIRQKSNQFLLKSLDTKGNYKPSFTDIQTLLTYRLLQNLEVSFLGNYAQNIYRLIPQDRETSFGTINEALRLQVFFGGQEVDRFNNGTAALSFTYKPMYEIELKLTGSYFRSLESESYDILGQYWIGQIETDLSKPNFGDVISTKGVGSFLNHSRNHLTADVFNVEHRGSIVTAHNLLQWGIKFQHEAIDDRLNEWTMIDSAGYSLPYPQQKPGDIPQNPNFTISSSLKTQHQLTSNRYSGFLQNTFFLRTDSVRIWINAGIRSSYWDVNNEWLFSPRAILNYKPNWKNNITFRFSTGLYQQPPFYRELRDLQGQLHQNTPAQKSIHLLTGSDWLFKAWDRPFKFTTEVYYKFLNDLIPYEIDNVRIRYLSNQTAKGFAEGIDFKINGEFVKGLESWASLSFMKTMEDIKGDFYYNRINSSGHTIIPGFTTNNITVDSVRNEPGYIPRPTDQRVNFSLFFQDCLPNNPTYKVHLSLFYGSRLSFGPPDSPKYMHTLRITPYRRVDIGFSKQIIGEDATFKPKGGFRYIKSLWISAEVFNLFQISNTISYIWINDVSNRAYAIPNYLTPRQINFKLIAKF
jgi:hypothetical protein